MNMYYGAGMSDELGETVNEMSTVLTDRNNNLSLIVVSDNKRRGNDAYFKLYNHQNFTSADKIARISFYEPKYIHHKDRDGKLDWKLNAKEKKLLMQKLNEPASIFNEYNMWTQAIILFNLSFGYNINEMKENTVNNHIHKGIIPFDLPIPDYTQLK